VTTSIVLRHGRKLTPVAAAVALLLSGCAAPAPAGPTVTALPAQGENFQVFQQHDMACRQYAQSQAGNPSDNAAKSEVGSAALGTAIGAGAGAAIGSTTAHAGTGALIGAGAGLLAGTLIGSSEANRSAAVTQHAYNAAYSQCMVANGDRIAAPPPRPVVYAPPPPPPVVYAPPPAVVYAPPPGTVYMAPPPPAYVAPY
jgi:hypothetical protein